MRTFSCIDIIIGTCPFLRLPYGTISYNMDSVRRERYPPNTIVTFTCNYRDPLDRDTSATCEASGNWSHPVPTCIGNKQKQICSLFKTTQNKDPFNELNMLCRILHKFYANAFSSHLFTFWKHFKWQCKL